MGMGMGRSATARLDESASATRTWAPKRKERENERTRARVEWRRRRGCRREGEETATGKTGEWSGVEWIGLERCRCFYCYCAASPRAPSTPVEATRASASARLRVRVRVSRRRARLKCARELHEHVVHVDARCVRDATQRDARRGDAQQEIGNTCTLEYRIRIGRRRLRSGIRSGIGTRLRIGIGGHSRPAA